MRGGRIGPGSVCPLLKRLVDFHLCGITGRNSKSRWKTLQQGEGGDSGVKRSSIFRERSCDLFRLIVLFSAEAPAGPTQACVCRP